MLLVKETEDRQLIIVNGLGDVVAVHRKLPGRHKRAIIAEHYAGLPVLARKGSPGQAIQVPADSLRQTGPVLVAPQVEMRPLSVYGQLSEVAHD
jgi:hypothetical protein